MPKLLSRTKVSGDGNSVGDYTEEVWECDHCRGNGEILDDTALIIPCRVCGGSGEWTIRR